MLVTSSNPQLHYCVLPVVIEILKLIFIFFQDFLAIFGEHGLLSEKITPYYLDASSSGRPISTGDISNVRGRHRHQSGLAAVSLATGLNQKPSSAVPYRPERPTSLILNKSGKALNAKIINCIRNVKNYWNLTVSIT